MVSIDEVKGFYKYILGRDMNDVELSATLANEYGVSQETFGDARRRFLLSDELYPQILEPFYDRIVSSSRIVRYRTDMGFEIYLDLRQLHVSLGIIQGGYEYAEISLLRRIVRDRDTFLDVGANAGFFSLAIASRPGYGGRVVAFEPLSSIRALFERSVEDNGFQGAISIHPIALGAVSGIMAIAHDVNSMNIGGAHLQSVDSDAGHREEVAVETLDRIVGELGIEKVDVMKVDIEGAEGLFLSGGEETIRRDRPTMLIEINESQLTELSRWSPGDLITWLQERDYHVWAVQPSALVPLQAAGDVMTAFPSSRIVNVFAVHRANVDATREIIVDL